MNELSTEQAWLQLLETPGGRELLHSCYYGWNEIEACNRFVDSEEWQDVVRIIRRLHRPGKRALDLGAGNGIGSFGLAQQGYSVVAVEPDPSRLVGYGALRSLMASSRLPIEHVDGYGENLPFANNSFDVVYVRQVLHHAQDLPQMLQEVGRVLQPHGIFIACREHVVDDADSLATFLADHPLHRFTGLEGAFSLRAYLDAMRVAGLRVEKVFGPWDTVINHYPKSNAEVRTIARQSAVHRFGSIGNFIARSQLYEKWYRRLRSKRDRRPGRLYTFVATAS